MSWDTANDAALAEGKRVLIDDPDRFDGVAVTSVDDPRALRPMRGPLVWPTPAAATGANRAGHRPHFDPRPDRALAAAGFGRRPLQAGVQDLARAVAGGPAQRL